MNKYVRMYLLKVVMFSSTIYTYLKFLLPIMLYKYIFYFCMFDKND